MTNVFLVRCQRFNFEKKIKKIKKEEKKKKKEKKDIFETLFVR